MFLSGGDDDVSALLNKLTSSLANFFVPQASILCDIMSNGPPEIEDKNFTNAFCAEHHRFRRHCFGGRQCKKKLFMKNTVLYDVLPCCLASRPLRQYCSVITVSTSDISHTITVMHLVVYFIPDNSVYVFLSVNFVFWVRRHISMLVIRGVRDWIVSEFNIGNNCN
jgi:hypothetical protein